MIPTGGLQFKKLKKRNFDAIWIPASQNPSKSKTFRLLLCSPSARIIYLLQFVLGRIRIKHFVESTAIWVNWMILFVNCRIILTSYWTQRCFVLQLLIVWLLSFAERENHHNSKHNARQLNMYSCEIKKTKIYKEIPKGVGKWPQTLTSCHTIGFFSRMWLQSWFPNNMVKQCRMMQWLRLLLSFSTLSVCSDTAILTPVKLFDTSSESSD